MRYLVIDPNKATATPVEMPYKDGRMDEVLKFAGLNPGEVEHASFRTANQHYGVVIYEFSFIEADYKPFGMGYAVFCGPAVFYRVNEGGETIDYDETDSELPTPRFFPNREEYALAMARGEIRSDYAPAWFMEGKDETPNTNRS